MSDTDQKAAVVASHPFKEIEPKWRKIWEESGFHTTDLSRSEKKFYSLVMFSYPSGDKLHVGHWYNFAPADTYTRKKRMEGYNTFEPMGYDSFGLPAENYAIKTGIHPAKSTAENIAYIRGQLKQIGAMYDWSRELATSDPEYYRWTQWLFLKLFEHGMAVRKEAPVNWCPSCKTVLANEQVVDNRCERCETVITRRNLKQWFFKITEYADRLLKGLEILDWPSKTLAMQQNWIGRSEGSEVIFSEELTGERISVFTTRADTLFGVTYIVLAPEHPLVAKLAAPAHKHEVKAYIEQSRKLSEIERLSTAKEKTGMFLGSYCINPVNGQKIPIWIADYVLFSYGTGAVMAVPGHDQRDWEFARKYELPIHQVIAPPDGSRIDLSLSAYEHYGIMTNSGSFNGLSSSAGIKRVTENLKENGAGEFTVNFRLRDWLISRQRYWGAPIPIIICPKCGDVAVPENELPVLLPDIKDFKPTGEGKSPLASSVDFVNVSCPKCGAPAKRETETMDTFVDSSWYFLRYLSPQFAKGPWDNEIVEKWLPVDMYIGGAEHAVMHLMYARFFCMFLHDIGLIPFEEPFPKLRHQGIITNKGAKISKSKGNVINPEKFLESYGSDTFRIYLMFMGSYSQGGDWDDSGINGISRFLGRFYRLVENNRELLIENRALTFDGIKNKDIQLNYRLNITIKRVSTDIENLEFNTAVAACMELVNELYKSHESHDSESKELFIYSIICLIKIMAPMAPHLCEELWHQLGEKDSIFSQKWPAYDKSALELNMITMILQVNGKLRGSYQVPSDIDQKSFESLVETDIKATQHYHGRTIVKRIFIPGKLMNIVVK